MQYSAKMASSNSAYQLLGSRIVWVHTNIERNVCPVGSFLYPFGNSRNPTRAGCLIIVRVLIRKGRQTPEILEPMFSKLKRVCLHGVSTVVH